MLRQGEGISGRSGPAAPARRLEVESPRRAALKLAAAGGVFLAVFCGLVEWYEPAWPMERWAFGGAVACVVALVCRWLIDDHLVVDPERRQLIRHREVLGRAIRTPACTAAGTHCITTTGRCAPTDEDIGENWEYRAVLVDRRGRCIPLSNWQLSWESAEDVADEVARLLQVHREPGEPFTALRDQRPHRGLALVRRNEEEERRAASARRLVTLWPAVFGLAALAFYLLSRV